MFLAAGISRILEIANKVVCGPALVTILFATGLYFTIRTGFLQVTCFPRVLHECIINPLKKKSTAGKGSITPFQALATALGGTIGTGNIAGVATAISIAGPGAVFWMMVAAFFGMMTKYAEVVLAIKYRIRGASGEWTGGPMYYIQRGANMPRLAWVYAFIGIFASLASGNVVQSNSVAIAMDNAFHIPPAATGIVLALVVGFTVAGGMKKIASVSQHLVPIMSIFYMAGALIVIIANIYNIPSVIGLIIAGAFKPMAPVGGFAGASVAAAMRIGVSRGIFTNEAGLGSASIAHSAADTRHPSHQGLWGIFEVFFDTIVVTFITTLAILTSGVWNNGLSGTTLTISAFETVLPNIGRYIIAVSLIFFAFSSIIAWSFYGQRCMEYIAGQRNVKYYIALFIFFTAAGAVAGLNLVWEVSDLLNGLMAIPNLIGVLLLGKWVVKLTREGMGQK